MHPHLCLSFQPDGSLLAFYFLDKPPRKTFPDYYQLIAQPIALKDIQAKLKAGEYTHFEALELDLALMADNARRFNGEMSEVFAQCEAVRSEFYRRSHSILESCGVTPLGGVRAVPPPLPPVQGYATIFPPHAVYTGLLMKQQQQSTASPPGKKHKGRGSSASSSSSKQQAEQAQQQATGGGNDTNLLLRLSLGNNNNNNTAASGGGQSSSQGNNAFDDEDFDDVATSSALSKGRRQGGGGSSGVRSGGGSGSGSSVKGQRLVLSLGQR